MTKRTPQILATLAVAVSLPIMSAAAAAADEPEGWRDTPIPHTSFLHGLLVLAGIPLAVIVLLALAVYLPSVIRGESVAPAGARAEDEWFGGRRDADKAIEARGSRPADDTGGASGSW